VQFQQDAHGRDLELRYFRDELGREVDFVILEEGRPIRLIECKGSDDELSPSLRLLKFRFKDAEAWQISATGGKDYISGEGVRVCPALTLLKDLI
jgi:predicted AAA+ superfamily ATPase